MRRAILTAVAALAAIYALFATWRQNERAAGLDFYIYFVNSQLASRADVSNIYDADEQARIGEEYYERAQRSNSELRKYDAGRRRFVDSVSSPFLYTTLRWVSRDYDRALRQYHALVLAAFAAGVLLLGRRVGMRWSKVLFLLAALLLWYRGFEADLRVGNVNSLQLAAIGAALSVPPLAAGVIVGLLVAFKPNLVLIPLLLIVSRAAMRDWPRLKRELAGGVIGILLAVAGAAWSYGTFNIWLQWVSRANEFYHRLPTRIERNVTPALALFHEHGAWVSYTIALVLTALVCIAIVRGKRRDDVLVIGAAILIYLLSATVVWLHYMVLVIVPAFGLMRWKPSAALAALALLLIAEEPYELLTRQPVYPHDAWLIGPALVALFVGAAIALARRNAPAESSPS